MLLAVQHSPACCSSASRRGDVDGRPCSDRLCFLWPSPEASSHVAEVVGVLAAAVAQATPAPQRAATPLP
jgi:hypothetical protein